MHRILYPPYPQFYTTKIDFEIFANSIRILGQSCITFGSSVRVVLVPGYLAFVFRYSLPVNIAMYNGRISCDAITWRSYSIKAHSGRITANINERTMSRTYRNTYKYTQSNTITAYRRLYYIKLIHK